MNAKTRITSILLCVCIMMGLMSVGVAVNAADTDSKPISNWYAAIDSGDRVADDLDQHYGTPVEIVKAESHYSPVQAVWTYRIGEMEEYKQLVLTSDVGHTTLDQFDGICFYANFAEGNKFNLNIGIDGFSTGCYISGTTSSNDGTDNFFFLPWDSFVHDGGNPDILTKDILKSASAGSLTIQARFWRYVGGSMQEVCLDITVSDIYGYKTNGSEDEKDYTFYIPHYETVRNLPACFGTEFPFGEKPTVATTTEVPQPTTIVPTTTAPTTVAPAPVKPAKVKKVTAKAKGKKKVKVTWKAAKNAKKYVVKYSYKKNMKSAKTKTVAKLKVTLKKLKSGKRVYIQVRGINGKTKGAFSAKKSVRVK